SGPHFKPSRPGEHCKAIRQRPEREFNTRHTGARGKFSRQMQKRKQKTRDRNMSILTPQEKTFLDVFLHEATTSPFTGPATSALHKIGVEYADISYLGWAYEQDIPRTGVELGHWAQTSPPLPWATREAV